MKKITIAIDGYSGTGKGTTARWVAQQLWYTYLDTGAMYRCATLYAVRHDLLDADNKTKAGIVEKLHIEFKDIDNMQSVWLNGEHVEDQIRDTSLALQMKPIVSCVPLRQEMIALQQSFGVDWGIVCEGRDIATHVFPDAQLKIFFICDVDTRVVRRIQQLTDQWLQVDKHKIHQEITMRDQTDYLGPNAVNKKAEDARMLDTSDLTIQQQIDQVVSRAHQSGGDVTK